MIFVYIFVDLNNMVYVFFIIVNLNDLLNIFFFFKVLNKICINVVCSKSRYFFLIINFKCRFFLICKKKIFNIRFMFF